jgi:hypothetical protein
MIISEAMLTWNSKLMTRYYVQILFWSLWPSKRLRLVRLRSPSLSFSPLSSSLSLPSRQTQSICTLSRRSNLPTNIIWCYLISWRWDNCSRNKTSKACSKVHCNKHSLSKKSNTLPLPIIWKSRFLQLMCGTAWVKSTMVLEGCSFPNYSDRDSQRRF